MSEHPDKIVCAYCERSVRVNRSGKVRKHTAPVTGKTCTGSGRPEEGFARAPLNQSR